MRQIIQSFADGGTQIVDVPAPIRRESHLLVRTSTSLISSGTERMLVDFGKANWFQKARQQPEKVKQVLQKARSDGLLATIDAVRTKLDQPFAPGYCNVGRVLEAAPGVHGVRPGDRVVSNGSHAEVVSVPHLLSAKVPSSVTDEAAAFTVVGAIGLQGIRLVQPSLGECVVVVGLGLIGLMTVQMLRAQGCRVLGVDFDPARLALATGFGADVVDARTDDVLLAAQAFSRERGVDAVLITAATQSNEPVSQAAQMCRKRGRIVLVGTAGLELSRADFYEKELSFHVSCSYGPGRYDPSYEERGQDYPVGFVRWTAQRNFEAVLDLMANGQLDVGPLVSHRFAVDQAGQAYDLLTSGKPSLGILLEYSNQSAEGSPLSRSVKVADTPVKAEGGSLAFLGAGNYAGRVLIPGFAAAGAKLQTVVSAGGLTAAHLARKHGFQLAATDEGAALSDPVVDAVVIATRHNEHARQVLDALRAGKHVFCEKPLCLTLAELDNITTAISQSSGQVLMLGFNRRFAPQVVRMKQLLEGVPDPKSFIMTVNAGAIPAEHWTQDRNIGGGRIIGEACHFVDLLRFLAGHDIVGHHAVALSQAGSSASMDDKVSFTLRFRDGSVGTVHYLANGDKAFPKERLEVFCGGRVLQLDNFRKLQGWGWNGFRSMNLWRQDKGTMQCMASFLQSVRGECPPPIPLTEILETTRVTIEIAESLA